MDMGLLGLGNESAAAAIARANEPPYTGPLWPGGKAAGSYRWIGFQSGIGAGGPITDHGGVATAGLRYMLLHTGVLVDGAPSDRLALLPAWPCSDWAVRFKLHAPHGTVIEGYYDGAGKLLDLSVTPEARKKDVVFAGCINASDAVAWRDQV
jgi:hypothetical protein